MIIVQVKKQCSREKCGSWYRKKYGPKYFCNLCGMPDKEITDDRKEQSWENRIKERAAKEALSWEERIKIVAIEEEQTSEKEKRLRPEAIQMEIKF